MEREWNPYHRFRKGQTSRYVPPDDSLVKNPDLVSELDTEHYKLYKIHRLLRYAAWTGLPMTHTYSPDRRTFLRRFFHTTAGLIVGSMPVHHMALIFARRQAPIPKVSIIIDDIGRSRNIAEMFLALPIPITYAVLPRLRRSEELCLRIHEAGHEVMLHQPMEPFDSSLDPGPGALFVGDPKGRIHGIINDNISAIPFARGINNHMGSRFTSAGSPMQMTLEEIRKNRLYFIDSLTSSRSCAYQTAKQFGIQAAKRDVFLDNDRSVEQILLRLEQLLSLAHRNGQAIGIGHPFPETAHAIKRFLHRQRKRPFLCVYASSVLNPSGTDPSADFAVPLGV